MILFFLSIFLIIDSYSLFLAVIAQTFNPTAKLVIPLAMPNKEAKKDIETHPVSAEHKVSN